ncbi:Methyltransferase domain-containing protein [Streptomyces sp. DvalAA-14]|uniref:class I SAM-dependent methyltransferase n=1 Tax=unclassified Streptomyces TaxID=2593676 RepID=UPI00081B7E0F|nr:MULTISPECIES: class I SAM-dependent methyltransferase [unclassified Streptomyces]MYS23658.1 methyltransferase domain-containing protein [Streptomyces sp. SID4948]SCE36736.1 Methyltransferase domain-containing protein [Streptomyces sp. DvalAA-14]
MADRDVERERRSRVFGTVAAEYARLRPAPCEAAVDWLLPDGGRRVLDLAAGAGTLTTLLTERVPEVTAVEPDDRMRAELTARCPAATVLNGTAEALPLPDGRLDAVVVASAWHWFDPARAVPEIGRVLRPGGRLGVVWNSLDTTVPWVAEWYSGLRPDPATARQDPAQRHTSRGERLRSDLLAPGSPFAEPEERAFSCTRRSTPGDAAALLGTYSRVILLSPEERGQLLATAEQTLRERLGLVGDEEFDLPFRSLCWRTTRSDASAEREAEPEVGRQAGS